jgi:hypothetical protein
MPTGRSVFAELMTHESQHKFQTCVGAPEPIVMNSDDAPATVADVVVVRNPSGAPLVVYATVKNQLRELLTLTDVEVFIFAADGTIRTVAFKPDRRPLAASASRIQRVNVNGAIANAMVVVTIARAATLTRSWKNPAGLDQARASLIRSHYSPGRER